MLKHLIHMAFLQYDKFHSVYGEYLLEWKDTSGDVRRSVLKCKTIGLTMHDKVLVQDIRLPSYLKLEH